MQQYQRREVQDWLSLGEVDIMTSSQESPRRNCSEAQFNDQTN
ncbi:hypothetical protein [Alteromonas sp. W12]|nr:hypothetical protein [Alteromonas sp. W12]